MTDRVSRNDETPTRPNASGEGSAAKVTEPGQPIQTWPEYGLYDEDGDLEMVHRDLSELRLYYDADRGDTIKVRTVTRTETEWEEFKA